MGKIPAQHSGAESDIHYSKAAETDEDAKKLYDKARTNLLSVNKWKDLAGKLSAAFLLTDHRGVAVNRFPLNGDYIRIHLPGSPHNEFDWVHIERVEEEQPATHRKRIMIQVRPSDAPKEHEETEHFFSRQATSNFFVERNGNKITAAVIGRNELPNLHRKGLLSKIRNLLISLPALAGANTPQWKSLTKGIIEK
jgi:hypothetical protein